MAKSAHSDVLDGLGSVVKTNCNQMSVCSAQPTTRAEAITTYMLGIVSMSTGDFTMAADGGGRKCTVSAKSDVSVTNSGTALYVAFVDSTRLLYVTTCTSQVLTADNTVNFPAVDICKVAQPT